MAILDLPEGEHQYKFFVDGQWVHDVSEVCCFKISSCFNSPRFLSTLLSMFLSDYRGLSVVTKPLPRITYGMFPLQPTVTSELGTINNLIQVKKSDFEVFDALQVDSLVCSDTSGQSLFNVTDNKKRCAESEGPFLLLADLSSSPPGPYGQEQYVCRPEEHLKAPPILPPHLLQVILNKDTNISVSVCPISPLF